MNSLTITIRYKLTNSLEWHIVSFTPEEYYDLDYNEKAEWDSIPLWNDTLDYLDIDKILVEYIETTIIDTEADIIQIFAESFWNKGKNRITETIVSGSRSWKETIVEINLVDKPLTYEILRYNRMDSFAKLSYHGLITDNDDGSQSEQVIYSN
ncbi:MAG: hypothetical protein AAGM46_24680 [Cyanobacteria bacterium J06582_2]